MRTNLWLAALVLTTGLAQNLPVPAAGNVTLPVDDYNRLTELASRPVKKAEEAPIPAVLKSASLNLRVNAESITGTVSLEGEVLMTGERKVPLVNGMIVLDAELRGKELPLEHEGNTHSAVLMGPGEFAISLNAALPLSIETGRASVTFPVPVAGATRLTLTLPGEQTQVNLSAGIVTSRSSQNGQTVVEATLIPGSTATLWWASRLGTLVAQAAPREARFLSEVRTLISASDAELAAAALVQITMVQGEPAEFRLAIPAGYEMTGASGSTLESKDVQNSTLILKVSDRAVRSHEFLLTFSKANASATKAEIPLVTVLGSQRETGEVLVESDGAMELKAVEQGGLRRMDAKELSASLRSLSRGTLQAAFRYQKRPTETPGLALDWVRFADSRVLSAVTQKAEVTTLVTMEGRSLSEIKLTVKNLSQVFLKVELPVGASILSAEVAGEKVKPVQGADGSRVPLLRAGFRPSGAYEVSFVILNAESPLGRKGDAVLALPKMDIPIGQVGWEVFLPAQLKVSNFGGDVRPARYFPLSPEDGEGNLGFTNGVPITALTLPAPGLLAGIVTDVTGGVVPRATVTVVSGSQTFSAIAGPDGRWAIPGVPSGKVQVTTQSPGFNVNRNQVFHDSSRGSVVSQVLDVGSTRTIVEVTAADLPLNGRNFESRQDLSKDTQASNNVGELQRKVVGVLPIAINIPHTGASYHFFRPLVVDEETKLTFRYARSGR